MATTHDIDLLDFDEAMEKFDPVFGIEVHVELNTKTKMFCGCPTTFGAAPNTHTCPVCLGLPGSMPVANEQAIESAVRLGLALHASIAQSCRFARKQYFYPDLAKNYQISQSNEPIVFEGYLDVELDDGDVVRVEIERAHMEEDAAKNTHIGGADGRIQGADHSLVDYNRGGVPLIEIVTKPVTGMGSRTPQVAAKYVETLRDLVKALGISDARMDQGSIRADVNLSLRAKVPAGQDQNAIPLGKRSETKNVNSIRAIEQAVVYEIQRHAGILDAGLPVTQETRMWKEATGTTSSGRPKSDADDYRYMPEPDLVPVVPDRAWVESLKDTLPEPPVQRRHRLQKEWGYSDLEMRDVVNADAIDLIEATVAGGAKPAGARKWWMGELARLANEEKKPLASMPVTPADIAALEKLIAGGKINDKLARQVLSGVLAGEGTPEQVVVARGLEVVSDDGALIAAVDDALAAMPDIAAKIRDGKIEAAGAIIGAVMKATHGQANAARVRELLMERVSA